jgi:hypothetical protein
MCGSPMWDSYYRFTFMTKVALGTLLGIIVFRQLQVYDQYELLNTIFL